MQNNKSNKATAQHGFPQESSQVQKALKTKTGYIWNDENGGWRCYAKVGDEITNYSKRYASEANAMSDFINWAKDVYGPNVKLNWQKGNYEELKRCLIANGDLKPEVKVQESSKVQKSKSELADEAWQQMRKWEEMRKIGLTEAEREQLWIQFQQLPTNRRDAISINVFCYWFGRTQTLMSFDQAGAPLPTEFFQRIKFELEVNK